MVKCKNRTKRLFLKASNFLQLKTPLAIACLILVALSTCHNAKKTDQIVKIGINSWTGYDPFIIAEQAGLFAKNNLNAEIVRYISAHEEINALRDGTIQGAALTLDEVVTLVSSGFSVKVVLILDYSLGGDMILGQPDINKMEQINGKKVGYEGSVVGEFLLYRALQRNGIARSNLELIHIPAAEWLGAFKTKKIDALVCYNPVAAKLIQEEKANLLYSSTSIPFEIIDVLVFSETYYEKNKDILIKVSRSWFDALEFQTSNQKEALQIITSIKNIDSSVYALSLKGFVTPTLYENLLIFNPASEQNIYKYAQPIISFMLDRRMINERINTADLFPIDILEATENHK